MHERTSCRGGLVRCSTSTGQLLPTTLLTLFQRRGRRFQDGITYLCLWKQTKDDDVVPHKKECLLRDEQLSSFRTGGEIGHG